MENNSNCHTIMEHFEDYLEEIIHGKGARQTYESIKLSLYACYLIVQKETDKYLTGLMK